MNQVEEFFNENPGVIYSTKTVSKILGLKVKEVNYWCYNSSVLQKVNPMEVGSLRCKLNLFKL